MAKRFYNPSTSAYVSQFVPDELPTEMMLRGIENKQKKYDTQTLLNDELQAYRINALPGEDTRYAKEWKNKIDAFIEESSGVDLVSPEYQRKYKTFIKDFKNDEGLKSVGSAYDNHQKYLARIEELTKKGAKEAADELRNDYIRRFSMYTAEDGLGYRGDVSLGDPLIKEGVDRYEEGMKFFKDLKESGSENVGFLEEGISYKNGWTGISNDRVKKQAESMYNDWRTSAGGIQTSHLFDMQNGIGDYEISKLSEDKRKEYEQAKENFLRNEFLQIGKTVVHGKSTTNIDDAYNIREGREYENKDLNAVITGQLEGEIIANPRLSWSEQLANIDKSRKDINRQLEEIKNGKTVAPGTEEFLRKRLNELNTEQSVIVKDRNSKYKSFHDQATKEILNAAMKEYGNLQNPYASKEQRDAAIKKLTDQKWKQYLSNTAQVQQHMGIITVPKGKGSIANTEQALIQGSGGAGYSFYDASTGKEITGQIKDLKTFELTGLTQGEYKGGQGKVGKVTIKQAVPDPEDPTNPHKVKYIERSVNVVAVSRDPNRQVTNLAYANSYFRNANTLRKQGDEESAVASEMQALRLLNPQLSEVFDKAGKSSSMRSTPITTQTSSGVNIMVDLQKLDDGTYNMTLMDSQGRALRPPSNFTTIEQAKQQVLRITLE